MGLLPAAVGVAPVKFALAGECLFQLRLDRGAFAF